MDPYGNIDRESFLQVPTPRRVPAAIRKAAASGRATWVTSVFGGVFLSMGFLASWFFIPRNLLTQWQLERDSAGIVPGRIIGVENTNMKVNNRRVLKGRFTFRLQGEKQREGEAYINGGDWEPGKEVRIRYLKDDPSRAVPEGGRLDGFPAGTLFVLIFPLVGAGFLLGGIHFSRMRSRILAHGLLSSGRVKSMRPTAGRINQMPVYKFSILREDDMREFTLRRHVPAEVALLQRKMAADEPLQILYDPNKPHRMLFPESWNL